MKSMTETEGESLKAQTRKSDRLNHVNLFAFIIIFVYFLLIFIVYFVKRIVLKKHESNRP